jgi:hypothetical protein
VTRESEQALRNAIRLEVKKDALAQRQSGDWSVRFTVAAQDMDQRLTAAPMGTRFVAALVQVNDDETPVDHKAKERDKWRALNPTQQAGIRCGDPVFWAFLEEVKFATGVNNTEAAARAVRSYCEITSRSQLNKPGFHAQRILWHQLDGEFQAWKLKEAHGG